MSVVNVKKAILTKRGIEDYNAWEALPNTVYIGRAMGWVGCKSSKWRNKFSVKKFGRDECIRLYKESILANKELLNDLEELRGKELGCWCAPEPCHGDILLELLNPKIEELSDKLEQLIVEDKPKEIEVVVDELSDELEQLIVEDKPKEIKVVVEDKPKEIKVVVEDKPKIEDEPKAKRARINPYEELEKKIKELGDVEYKKNKEDSLRNCYAYKCWLWTNHGRTYDEEMERVGKVLAERDY